MNPTTFINHTLLDEEASREQISPLCLDAQQYGFTSVCVNSKWVSLCSNLLTGTSVKICTVVGLPLGATHTNIKVDDASLAVQQGASEISLIINITALKEGNLELVEQDILAVRCAIPNVTLVIIIEASLLTDKENFLACQIAQKAGANFVKTSTGLSPMVALPAARFAQPYVVTPVTTDDNAVSNFAQLFGTFLKDFNLADALRGAKHQLRKQTSN